MTFAAVSGGQFGEENSATVSVTTHAVGNFILVSAGDASGATALATALSSSHVTWTKLGTSFAGTTYPGTAQVFIGQVTSVATATVTATYSGTPVDPFIEGREFSTTAGFAAVTFDKQGHIDSAGTNTWASLTPANSGSLYWGYAQNDGSATAGSTSGYVYTANSDGHSNGEAYNLSCPAGTATAPVWGDSGEAFGIMVVLYEAYFAPVGSLINATASTFSLTPGGVGDLVLLEVVNEGGLTCTCTGLSSSNVTWEQIGSSYAGTVKAYTSAVFADRKSVV